MTLAWGVKKAYSTAIAVMVALFAVLMLGACGESGVSGGGSEVEGPPRDTTPEVLQVSQPGTAVVENEKAVLDYSNVSEGYICVMSNLASTRIKVLVDVAGTRYQYNVDTVGSYVTIPLSQSNETYTIGVWENISGDSYAAVFSRDIEVTLIDGFKPFLYPSQFVDFASGDEATSMSQQLAEGSVTDVDVINKVYRWVCENIDYDMDKATTVASGYLPNNTETINAKKGICFDYAVLTASMLRAQRIPAKLVIGYAGTAYHAWMEVYSTERGTVISYVFNGDEWVRLDPTFDAASRGSQDLRAVIGDGRHYQPLFFY